jgi:hypothetical protein
MLIDYVRVYQERRSLLNGVFDSASFSAVVAPEELATIFGYELASSTSGALYDASAGAFARKITPAENLPTCLLFSSPVEGERDLAALVYAPMRAISSITSSLPSGKHTRNGARN